MKKIIAFSLYGDRPLYTWGMIANVQLAKIIYPDWVVRIHYKNDVPQDIIEELKQHSNVEMVLGDPDLLYPMTWRFIDIDNDDVSIIISRDADSRLSYREKKAVDIFLQSDKLLHSIRDNISHNNIMGGCWGIKKNNRIENLRKSILSYQTSDAWINRRRDIVDFDQQYLRNILLPNFSDSILTHCSYYLNNYPVEKENGNPHFVGEVFPPENFNQPKNYIFY